MAIKNGEEYIQSLRNRDMNVWILGEKVPEPVDHPFVRPSINAVAETYDLAVENPDLGSAWSPLIDGPVNRFTHIAMSKEDLVQQSRMQRHLGQKTGTCFQRCVGMDAINALFSVTYDCDEMHKTNYHERLKNFVAKIQKENFVLGGAMTDPKGDRSKGPSAQTDPDMYLHIVDENDEGVFVTGAKMHQTGTLNSHYMVVMPTTRLLKEDKDYGIVGAIPVDAPGITYIYGRQSSDLRACEPGVADKGNAKYGGQETMVVFDKVFIPHEHVFMKGETEFAGPLVNRFTCYHRRSYICKSGLGDVMIGAAATAAEYNGAAKASHIKDKIVEMSHLNETIAGNALAASWEGKELPAGNYLPDEMMANVCKQNVTRFPYEISRLAQDIAGGLMVTMPSAQDFENEELGPILEKYLKGVDEVPVEDRRRILRLLENMTLGRNAAGYLTESMHGAGSPQAQRIQMQRLMNLENKKQLAKRLADIEEK